MQSSDLFGTGEERNETDEDDNDNNNDEDDDNDSYDKSRLIEAITASYISIVQVVFFFISY